MFNFNNALLCSAALVAITVGTPVLAQENAANTSAVASEDEIIVTATKRDQTLKDVPVAVDVVTGKDLEQYNLFDFKDIAKLAPGLELTSNGRNTIATLRGISFNPDIGGPAAIAVYFNEVPVDINVLSTAMYDVQQVEVLRGPQGTLRGRTAPAGAITVTTRRADLDDITGQAQVTLGDRGARNAQAAVSVPLIEGRLAIRLAGLTDRNRANQTFNITRGERSRQRTDSFRATASFGGGDFSANLIYQYTDSYLRQSGQVFGTGNQPSLLSPDRSGPAIPIADRLSVTSGLSYFTNRTHILLGDFRWDTGDFTVSGLAGYQHAKLFSQSDQDTGNAVPTFDQYLVVPNPTRNYTAELRVDSNFGGLFDFTVGAFYNKNTSHTLSTFRVDSFFGNRIPYTPFPATMFALPITALVDITNNTEDLAIFGNTRFQFTEKLRLEVGARLTRNKAFAQSYLTVTSPGGVGLPIPGFTNPNRQPTVDPQFVDRTNWPLTGTASLSYDWTPDITTYVTVGRSFRRGSAQLGVTSTLDSSLLVLQPERSNAIEAGFKSQLFDRRVSLNLAAYYQKFDGFIGLTSVVTSSARNGVIDGGSFTASFNGDAIAKGVEMQLAASPTSFWDATVGMSYNDARYDNARAPCNDFNFDGIPDATGTPAVPVGQQVSFCNLNDRLNNAPEFSMTATSELRAPLGPVQAFVRGLYTYRPGFVQESANSRIPANHNLDLFAGIRDDKRRWEVTLFARNALDSHSLTAIGAGELQLSTRYLVAQPAGSPASPPFRSGYRSVSTRLPREAGVTVSVSF